LAAGYGAAVVGETRIQLCGSLVARIDGRRVEGALPGRQGRLLLAVLVGERRAPLHRDALVDALWGDEAPEAADAALSALLSKLRRIAPLAGRTEVKLVLPPGAWVDVEAAAEALHRAESAVAREDWTSAWGPARVAQHVAARGFLPGERGGWVERRRGAVREMHLRALELAGVASLRIGGGELATAERAARALVALTPLRESGTRLLMEVCSRRGNRADALLAYDALRTRLRDELAVAPSPETQALHRSLLA
jgi:DNA-binding SARP family transcriptional activator